MRNMIIAAVLVVGLGMPAMAHPASKVVVTNEGERIVVTTIHGSRDVQMHFINEVKVSVNGKPVITQICLQQSSPTQQVVSYVVPGLRQGDTINATTQCSKGGERSGETLAR